MNFFEFWQRLEGAKIDEVEGGTFKHDPKNIRDTEFNQGRTVSQRNKPLLRQRMSPDQLTKERQGAKKLKDEILEKWHQNADFGEELWRLYQFFDKRYPKESKEDKWEKIQNFVDKPISQKYFDALVTKLLTREKRSQKAQDKKKEGQPSYLDQLENERLQNPVANAALAIANLLRTRSQEFDGEMMPIGQLRGWIVKNRSQLAGGLGEKPSKDLLMKGFQHLLRVADDDLFIQDPNSDNIGVRQTDTGKEDMEDVASGNRGIRNTYQTAMDAAQEMDKFIAQAQQEGEDPRENPVVMQNARIIANSTDMLMKSPLQITPEIKKLNKRAHEILKTKTYQKGQGLANVLRQGQKQMQQPQQQMQQQQQQQQQPQQQQQQQPQQLSQADIEKLFGGS